MKAVPSLLPNVDLSTKKIQAFNNNSKVYFKLVHNFFGGDVAVCIYPTPSYVTFYH